MRYRRNLKVCDANNNKSIRFFNINLFSGIDMKIAFLREMNKFKFRQLGKRQGDIGETKRKMRNSTEDKKQEKGLDWQEGLDCNNDG